MKALHAWLPLLALTICAQDGPSITGRAQKGVPLPTRPLLISSADAEYTPEARAAGLQGTVSLYVEVDVDGKPARIQVLHGLGLGLDAMAMQAVMGWLYNPGRIEGRPVKVARSADVNFNLPDGGPWRVRLAFYSTLGPERGDDAPATKPFVIRYAAPDSAACPAAGGGTIVDLRIGSDGVPRQIRPRTSRDTLGAAAAKAIESWRFKPGTIDGKDREAEGSIEFECGPPPVLDSTVYRIGNGVTPPEVIYKPEPSYTKEARAAEMQGDVRLALVVDATGHTTEIHVVTPLGFGLDAKAMETIKLWRFKPGTRAAKPVNVEASILTSFHLL
ncbi:MAG: TonB family protein [Acidobacteriota bacterium]